MLQGLVSLVQAIHHWKVYKRWGPALQRVRGRQGERKQGMVGMVARLAELQEVKLEAVVVEHLGQLMGVAGEVLKAKNVPGRNGQPAQQLMAGLLKGEGVVSI